MPLDIKPIIIPSIPVPKDRWAQFLKIGGCFWLIYNGVNQIIIHKVWIIGVLVSISLWIDSVSLKIESLIFSHPILSQLFGIILYIFVTYLFTKYQWWQKIKWFGKFISTPFIKTKNYFIKWWKRIRQPNQDILILMDGVERLIKQSESNKYIPILVESIMKEYFDNLEFKKDDDDIPF